MMPGNAGVWGQGVMLLPLQALLLQPTFKKLAWTCSCETSPQSKELTGRK